MTADYSRHYARFHPATREHEVDLAALMNRWLGSHLPVNREAQIIDIGCGRGYAVQWLSGRGYRHVAGIDIDAGQVAFAQARGLNVTLVPDPVAHLRDKRETFDLVLLMDVLEHVPCAKRAEFLRSIAESLTVTGTLVCTVPNACSALGSYWRYVDPTHVTAFTTESLVYELEAASLVPRSVGPAEFFVRPRFLFWVPTARSAQWWIQRLARAGRRLQCLAELGLTRGWQPPLSPNLIAVARRS
jgi:2-polyprenyl-3-methyl-5-hydroxy-6-metoxy-1,4-benzoquinol methylase